MLRLCGCRRVPPGGAHNGVSDVVQVGRASLGQLSRTAGAACGCIALFAERLFASRATAEHDIACKQTFVLSAFAFRLQRILLPRFTVVLAYVRWRVLGGVSVRVATGSIIERSQAVLEFPQPIGTEVW